MWLLDVRGIEGKVNITKINMDFPSLKKLDVRGIGCSPGLDTDMYAFAIISDCMATTTNTPTMPNRTFTRQKLPAARYTQDGPSNMTLGTTLQPVDNISHIDSLKMALSVIAVVIFMAIIITVMHQDKEIVYTRNISSIGLISEIMY